MAESYLRYERFRHLKVALALTGTAIAATLVLSPPSGANGGTWVGYGLGTLSALLMGWLMWLGVRKRQYGADGAPLRGWVSAHVYLGVTLLVLVPLHAGFQVGWNLHSAALVLTVVVVLTGLVGVVVYAAIPEKMTRNRPGEKIDGLLERIAHLDTRCRQIAEGLPDSFGEAVLGSIQDTRIGGSLWIQLAGSRRAQGAHRALEQARAGVDDLEPESREQGRQLLELMASKARLVDQVNRDVGFQAILDLWLVLHVPLAFAAVAAVAAHVFVVFYYR